ncbi:homocysteine S-methyltransferase family protein [Acuticoccus mangrovi]|uniref:Homocysteine S-methyltransferase family protein n=1 Tax=Acuticoccus mangrovi TaxID=2796142 RepID=A0A934IMR8_9HYPH|nr:homocysteine S-methyltransferase family protein [Acuticoccus mangrovi]MBJ3775296.1 homocysteine S-methyltransferase family protein [Acuticoccus mangrovi]
MSTPLDTNVRYLTDSGLETTLVFHDGRDLPAFAAFVLLDDVRGRARLDAYYREHADVAKRHGMGFIFEAPTWRSNPDWGREVGYNAAALDRINCEAIDFLRRIELDYRATPTLVSGQIGPRGDGYKAGEMMMAGEAATYHVRQIAAFSKADMVTALTMTYVDEAVGIALAAENAQMPVVISFTTETDGRLPSGQPLGEAIEECDARTDGYVAYYMVNCAHPEHFAQALDGSFAARIRGLRANASCLSHAELDAAETLDIGDPPALGAHYRALTQALPELTVFGGCCGTDIRHIHHIVSELSPVAC